MKPLAVREDRPSRIVNGVEYFDNGDGQDDAQCARCGSSVTWTDCPDCGGVGDIEVEVCRTCKGRGVLDFCLSSPEWCEAHPLPGREKQCRAGGAA